MPAPTNKDLDSAIGVAQWSPKAIAAKELLMQKAAVGSRSSKAASSRATLKKVAAPLELGFHVVEGARLVHSPEVRELRVEEAKDLARKGMMRRMFAAVENPVGLVYGTAAIAKEARDTINDPRLKEQNLAYLKWRAERDYAKSKRTQKTAQEAGSQQKSREAILRDKANALRSARVAKIVADFQEGRR